jgi:hypothetical protein
MTISSLGRAFAGPALREPVSPLSSSTERLEQTNRAANGLNETQVTQEVTQGAKGRIDSSAGKMSSEAYEQPASVELEQSTSDAVAEMTELLQKRSVDMSVTGPLNRPDFKVIDRVNNIDFERAIPTSALRDRIFEMREDFIADLSKDTISFDSSSPLGRRVIVIKENINETEFVRHLPRSYNMERVEHLVSFASERGFNFEAVA